MGDIHKSTCVLSDNYSFIQCFLHKCIITSSSEIKASRSPEEFKKSFTHFNVHEHKVVR